MNPEVDAYLLEGCGRCSLGGTPDCKVHRWTEELKLLRGIMLEAGLTEEVKWSVPNYTHKKRNVAMVAAFKDYCSLSFFKGALLKDELSILEKPGENTQAGRVVKFTDTARILELKDALRELVFDAIAVQEAGKKVQFKKIDEYEVPEEFQQRLATDPDLKAAFEALTPGRQKGYLLHFAGAKQSKTREARIDKYIPKIMQGLGLHDR
ncbi:MAG: YdeI/OmpD-associated family protein [Muricauda sp.]|nr:YdeI/OmpD-associated family protein [Allomuricauda sp.]